MPEKHLYRGEALRNITMLLHNAQPRQVATEGTRQAVLYLIGVA